jgi:hypothetical protein
VTRTDPPPGAIVDTSGDHWEVRRIESERGYSTTHILGWGPTREAAIANAWRTLDTTAAGRCARCGTASEGTFCAECWSAGIAATKQRAFDWR